MRKICFCLLALASIPICNSAAAKEVLKYEDITKRLYTLDYLSEFPKTGEKSGNFSSFDRDSKYNEQTGSYENWFANKDGNGYIRKEGSEIVAAEIEGPGVIWRIWSAKPEEGHIKIFIDGQEKPVLDIPFREYFNSTSGLFAYPALVYTKAKGFNNYIPITFQKSCKITLSKGWGRYYQFTYSTYNKSTIIPSFRGIFTDKEKAALSRSNLVLSNNMEAQIKERGCTKIEKPITVSPGETVQVCMISGAKAIRSFHVKLNQEEGDDPVYVLRELALSISWDDEPDPSVWTPLGDFFGSAPGINKYKSFPLGMTNEGFYSNWYMPFAKNASVKLTNDGKQKRKLTFEITYVPLKRPADQLLRFHAKWHRDSYPGDDKEKYLKGDRGLDWPILRAVGKGRFCGVCLNVWNQYPSWWGEGDEKFFVDGEKFPSTFGTGSEDYFGYAWGAPEYFESAFQNQTLNIKNLGHISVNRFQISDNVPFMSSFEGYIEKYRSNESPCLYSCVAYWYQQAGKPDQYGPVAAKERVDYYIMPENKPKP